MYAGADATSAAAVASDTSAEGGASGISAAVAVIASVTFADTWAFAGGIGIGTSGAIHSFTPVATAAAAGIGANAARRVTAGTPAAINAASGAQAADNETACEILGPAFHRRLFSFQAAPGTVGI